MSSMIMAMILFVFFTLLFVCSYLFVFKKSNEIDSVKLYKKVEACLFYLIVLIFLAFGFWASR
jgi:hypothetical protein